MSKLSKEKEQNIFFEKIDFIGSYFKFTLQYIGVLNPYEFDNHLSAIEKMRFQWANGTENKRRDYIKLYLDLSFMHQNDKALQHFISNYPYFKDLVDKLTREDSDKKIINTELKKNDFQLDLKNLSLYLETIYSDFIIESFKSSLFSQNSLSQELEYLIYWLNIIISELFFKGYSYSELYDYMNGIMGSWEYFPYPEEFLDSLKDKPYRLIQLENYYSKLSWNERIDGFKNLLYRNERTYKFYFQVANLLVDEHFYFSNVLFSHRDNPIFEEIFNHNIHKGSLFYKFFKEEEITFAGIEIKNRDFDKAYKLAVFKIEKTILTINNLFDSNCYLNNYHYIHSIDNLNFGMKSRINEKHKIKSWHLRDLYESDPIQFLRDTNKQAKEDFLFIENIFEDAVYGFPNAKRIANYWTYLEALFGGTPLRETVTNILLVNEITTYQSRLLNYLKEHIESQSYYSSADREHLEKLYGLLLREKYQKFIETIQTKPIPPFITFLTNQYIWLNSNKKSYLKKVSAYYNSILFQIYEVRNIYYHKGKSNDKSVIKMNQVAPILVAQLRWLIMDRIKKDESSDLKSIINKLEEEGKALLN